MNSWPCGTYQWQESAGFCQCQLGHCLPSLGRAPEMRRGGRPGHARQRGLGGGVGVWHGGHRGGPRRRRLEPSARHGARVVAGLAALGMHHGLQRKRSKIWLIKSQISVYVRARMMKREREREREYAKSEVVKVLYFSFVDLQVSVSWMPGRLPTWPCQEQWRRGGSIPRWTRSLAPWDPPCGAA